MKKYMWRTLGAVAVCGMIYIAAPAKTYAEESITGPSLDSGNYVVTVDATAVNINKEFNSEEVLIQASKGAAYQVLQDMGGGWMKIKVNDTVGYMPVSGNATVSLSKAGDGGVDPAVEATIAADRRQSLVNYALQFVGGKYRYGGSDPRTGVDCSGFTRYVMLNGAGVSLNRSSGSQAQQGRAVSSDQMRPGDLIFYGGGGGINHVAMYIGDGQIVHASTYKTGIKTSPWNYRTPVKIVNVLGD